MRQLLATFIQISDLHIGEIDPTSGNSALSRVATRLASNFSHLDGLLGHHSRGLEELADFVSNNKPSQGQFRLIVTGDMSRRGANTELALARQYLLGHIDLTPPHGNNVGLGLQPHELMCIPGNHDHWGGSWQPISGNPSNYQAYITHHATPYVDSMPLSNGRKVVFVGINSDRDVWSFGIKRFMAVGSFRNELKDAKLALPTNRHDDIRICLIHHSLSVRTRTLRMDKASRMALLNYLQAHKFNAVLTGHTHVFSLPTTPGGSAHAFEELRSGTTTQYDQVPPDWVTVTGSLPSRNWPANTLLRHQIWGTPGKTIWETQAYARFQGSGFMPLGFQHSCQLTV